MKNLTSTGYVDGFFGDKWDSGAKQNKKGHWQICNHECGNVTASQAAAWNKGKAVALKAATEYVGKGPYFSNGNEFEGVMSNLNGHWGGDRGLKSGDPRDNIKDVNDHLVNHSYFYMSCTGDQHWTTDPNDPKSLVSACNDQALGRFLLAVEEGCFFGTNGWDPDYAKPLGDPTGPAVYTPASGDMPATLHRNFSSGTYIIFTYSKTGKDGTSEIFWEGKPPPPPPPPSPPVVIQCGSCGSTLLNDTTFASDDIAPKIVTNSALACCNKCTTNPECVQWAWHGTSDQTCHLHGKKSTLKQQTGTVAGVMNRTKLL